MAQADSTPAAGSAPVTAPPAASTPAPSAAEFKAEARTNTPLADLDAMLGGATPEPAKPEAAAPVVEPPKPAEIPPVPPVEPPKPAEAAKTDEDEPTHEKLGKFRLRARDFKEAEFLRLCKTVSPQEAYAQVYGAAAAPDQGTKGPKDQGTEPASAAAPTSQFDSQIKSVNDEITALNAKLETAHEAVDTREVSKLTLEISRKERQLERLNEQKTHAADRAEQEKAQTAEHSFRERERTAANEVRKLFPQLGDKTSAERQEFDAWLKLRQEDPDYAPVFESPRWPIIVAREFAELKGLKGQASAPASLPPATPANQTPAPGSTAPRTTAATVLTPGSAADNPSFAPTRQSFVADVKKMPVAEIDKLLAAAAA